MEAIINYYMLEKTVFVVDDDEAMRDSLKWLLESVGMHVILFSSAEEFLKKLELKISSGSVFSSSCLVTDVCMPGMSGLALQEVLISKNIQLPVIVITGYGNEAMVSQAISKGAVDCINKPFSDDVLLDRIQSVLG